MHIKLKMAIKNAKLLKTSSKKGLFAPGSIVQVLARSPELLAEFETKLHLYTKQKWEQRIPLIKKGYGLSLIKVPCEDQEINELDDVDAYMKQLVKLKGE